MKIMKNFEFLNETHENHIIRLENHENYANIIISIKYNENHENHRIPFENYEIH